MPLAELARRAKFSAIAETHMANHITNLCKFMI